MFLTRRDLFNVSLASLVFAPQILERLLAIERVTIVDDGRLLHDHTVVVQDSRISVVGASPTIRMPQGTRTVDGRGRYLIRGCGTCTDI